MPALVAEREGGAVGVRDAQRHRPRSRSQRPVDGREKLVEALARDRGHGHGPALGHERLERRARLHPIHLVEDENGRAVGDVEVAEQRLDRHHLLVARGMAGVHHVEEHIRVRELLEGGAERGHELVGQLADEADGVGEDERRSPVPAHDPRGRIQGDEELIGGGEACPAQPVQQRCLAGVGVADQRHHRDPRAPPSVPLQPPMALHALQLATDLHDSPADDATVRLELCLTRPARADATAEPLQVRPLPDQSGQQIRELGQLDLQLALAGARALGEDVQDESGAVDDLDPEGFRDIALLDRRERVVGDEDVGAALARHLRDLVHLAASEVEARRGGGALLGHPLDHLRAGGAGEAFQLGQGLLDLPAALRGPPDRRDHRALAPSMSINLHRSLIILSTSSAAPAGPPAASTSIH